MKITKKLLCMALSVIMLASCLSTAVFADGGATKFSDVNAGEIYSTAVSTLNLMGVINGYEDGTFKPDQNVTRAEFTAMLMRTLNYGSTGSTSAAELPFTDIDDNNSDINWSIPNINTAYAMGIINGYEDSTFRPTANVAFEEAVKMIVCTLGYGNNVDVNVEPWYANFIAVASQIGLTKNANKLGAAGTPATRACIAQLLYDALEIDLVEKDEKTNKTILSDYLGYVKNIGVISSNDITSLTSADVNLREDEIQITAVEEGSSTESTYTYSTTDLTLKDYLGYEVEFYYKSDGSDIRTLMFCVVNATEPVTINASDIEESSSTSSQIKYYKNADDDKESSIALESDNVVIFNGKLYGSTAGSSRFDASMLPEVGSVTLIDSDNNKKYDVVNIESYEIYYVSEKSTSTYEIIDNVTRTTDNDNHKLVLDNDADRNLKIVNASGSEVSFSSIAKGNVICYAKSNGSDPISKAIVVTDKVTGTVSATKGNKVTISNKEYKYSKAAPWVSGATNELSAPVTQDSGTYYLDINGDVVAYDKSASNENVYYGYILGYSVDKDSFDGSAIFRVLTESNGEVRIGTYKNTKVDGQTCSSGTDVVSALEASAQNQNTGGSSNIQQLIKYTTRTEDGNTVFNKIYTANVGAPAKVESDALAVLDDGDNIVPSNNLFSAMEYNSSSKTLTGNKRSIKLTKTVVFSIPDDRTDYDSFAKTAVTTSFKDGLTYDVEFFDVDNTNVAAAVVLYGANNAQGVDSASPMYILTELPGKELDANDNTMVKMTGYKSSPDGTSSFSELFSDDCVGTDDLEIGDIFRAGTDRDGMPLFDLTETDYVATEMIYDMDGNNTFKITKEPSSQDMYRAEYVTILGTVVARSESNIVVAPEDLGPGDTQEDESENITFSASDFSRATVLKYDTTGQQGLKLIEEDYSSAIAGLTAFDGTNNASKVFIYMSEGDINLLCILPVK